MGGAAALMYVVGCRLRGVRHYLDKMILLSPAGIVPDVRIRTRTVQGAACTQQSAHYVVIIMVVVGVWRQIPKLAKVVGPIMYFLSLILKRWIYAFRFPSELSRVGALKIMQDFRGLPALRDLLSVAISGLLLGSGTRAQVPTCVRKIECSVCIGGGACVYIHP